MNLIMQISKEGEPNPEGGGSPSFLFVTISIYNRLNVEKFIYM